MEPRPYLEIGKIINTHGVRGEVKLEPWADSPAQLKDLRHMHSGDRCYDVEQCRVHGRFLIVKLAGVDTVEAAMALKGRVLTADRAELFVYENGTPAFLGHVASGGTANPLMLGGGKLYTAGHHFVESATLSGGTSLLTLRVSETFDADGNVRYSAESSDGTGSVSEDATLFEELWAAYGESEIIAFNEVK